MYRTVLKHLGHNDTQQYRGREVEVILIQSDVGVSRPFLCRMGCVGYIIPSAEYRVGLLGVLKLNTQFSKLEDTVCSRRGAC